MVTTTVQNVLGSATPVQALNPPPEGNQGVQLSYEFTPTGLLTQGQILQLNQPGGLALSQVVSLVIDNSQNPNSVTITHGAFNETVTIEAGGFQVLPTFSTKSFFSISLMIPAAPAQSFPVRVIFLNYDRQQFNIQSASQVVNNNIQAESSGSLDIFGASGLIVDPVQLIGVGAGQYAVINGFDVEVGDWGSTTAPPITQINLVLGWSATPGNIPFWQTFLATSSVTPAVASIPLTQRDGLYIPGPIGDGLFLAAYWNNPASQITPAGHSPIATVNLAYTLVTP